MRPLGALAAAVVRALHRGIEGEGMHPRVQRRERVDVETDGRLLVAAAHEIVEHRRLGDRELLIEQPGLARVDGRPERGALQRIGQLRQRDEEVHVELAYRPQLAPLGDEGDPQPRERIEVLGAPLPASALGRREDEDRMRTVAPALGHRLQSLRGQLDEDVLLEGLREQDVADQQQPFDATDEPGQEGLALRPAQPVEVDQAQPRPGHPFQRGPAADSRAGTRRSRRRAGSCRHRKDACPGRCHVEGDHRNLVRSRTFEQAKKSGTRVREGKEVGGTLPCVGTSSCF